jgi:hypothetical protein
LRATSGNYAVQDAEKDPPKKSSKFEGLRVSQFPSCFRDFFRL